MYAPMYVSLKILSVLTTATLVGSALPAVAQFSPPVNRPGLERRTVTTTTGTYFRPPRDSRPAGDSTTTGTRSGGCLGLTDTPFTLLGPTAVLGQTTAERPEFVWHLPEIDGSFPVVFRLLAPDSEGIPDLVHSDVLDYAAGFSSYQLPASVPALPPGVAYRVQVYVECNPNYPSQDLVQEVPFEVVAAPPTLGAALTAASTDAERAIAYGQAGLWYDALAEVAPGSSDTDRQTRRQLLLDLAASLDGDSEALGEALEAIAGP